MSEGLDGEAFAASIDLRAFRSPGAGPFKASDSQRVGKVGPLVALRTRWINNRNFLDRGKGRTFVSNHSIQPPRCQKEDVVGMADYPSNT